MRLLDLVAQARDPVRVALRGRSVWELPGAASMAEAVAATPVRYILADNVRDACHEIAARWPELMDPASASLRLPVPALWVEWNEPGGSGAARRAGMLVRAGDSDRCGSLHAFWDDPETGAEMAQAHVEFDLDRVVAPGPDCRAHTERLPGLRLLAPHFRMVVEPQWMRFFASATAGPEPMRSAVARCAVQALPNFCFLVSLIRLLAVRANVDEKKVERAELNRARERRGKPPLLDHVEVSLAVGGGRSGAIGHRSARAPCRQHVVRGHIVNRRGTIFWRATHLRGRATATGKPVKRNVRLSVAQGFRAEPSMWPSLPAAE